MIQASHAGRPPEPAGSGMRPSGMMMNMLRAGTGARSILIAAVCAAALSACGSVHATGGSAAGAKPASKVALVIQVAGKPGAAAHRWTLRCDPVGGTHPNPAAACHALMHAKRPFAPLPKNQMCPMIVAGPETAHISGTWFGRHIDTNFNQTGCGNLRWNKIGQVFN